MKKFFVILPDNMPLLLCGKGYYDALKSVGFFAEKSIISELDDRAIIDYSPDCVLFFDFNEDILSLINKLRKGNKECIFIFYLTSKITTEKEKFIQNIKNKKFKRVFFTADKENMSLFKGINYLPIGINGKKYKADFDGYKNTVNIIANPENEKTIKLFEYLNEFFDNISFYADENEYIKSLESSYFLGLTEETKLSYKKSYKGSLSSEKERSKAFSESYINIVLNDKVENGIEYSILEVMASGSFVFCESKSEIRRLFDVGREIETFDNFETLLQKIEFYMRYPQIGHSIGLNARSATINNHSAYDRVRQIEKILKKNFLQEEKENE